PRPILIDHKLDMEGTDRGNCKLPVPNPTLLPDRVVTSISPVIIIRHPMFTYPSFARASSSCGGTVFDTEFPINSTYRFQRIIHDFYHAYFQSSDLDGKQNWPIVIDGDKLMEDTQGQMSKFCAVTGINESLIQYSWDASPKSSDKFVNAYIGTVMQSTGVSSKTSLEEQFRTWIDEWDEKVAQRMREAVESSMEDYEYLLKFSL
ncbi:hypothetical protein GYMLUDRAFT_160435, partial [Collybiopsis luxurians FD-317 M1]